MKVEETVLRVIEEEANAVRQAASLAPKIAEVVKIIANSTGPLILSGVGKSGHIGCKIASTFCSLGKPAIFVHAAEASHGDLGLIQKDSAVIVLSNSGETTELSDLLSFCRAQNNTLIALTGRAESTLANIADIAIVYEIEREACRNGLAPTTSTTVALVIGDALAVSYSELTGLTPEDFRRYHPGGKLAAKLREAKNLMTPIEECPVLDASASMEELLLTMSEGRLGICVLIENGKVFGVVSDGDLRRNAKTLMELSPREIATQTPVKIQHNMRADDISNVLNQKRISQVLVFEGEQFIGIVHILMLGL